MGFVSTSLKNSHNIFPHLFKQVKYIRNGHKIAQKKQFDDFFFLFENKKLTSTAII